MRRFDRTGLRWIAGSALGVGLGMTLGIVVVEMAGRALTGGQVRLLTLGPVGRVLGLSAVGAITGLVVGAAQSLALRARMAWDGRWVLWCGLGFGGLRTPAGFAVFLATAGLILGLLTARGADRITAAAPR